MSERMRRVNESVRVIVAESVRELKDPRIGLVTVTGVRVTPDLQEATVYFSVLGNPKKQRSTLLGLQSARGILQSRINEQLKLRGTPTLTFEYDETVERDVRMTALIDELAREPPDEQVDDRVSELDAVAEALQRHDRFLVVTHENPDGDALGSMLALTLGLRKLGKDVVMYLADDAPLPGEYLFLELDDLRRELPDDLAERVLVAVDCASERRIGPDPEPLRRAREVIDIDHHHDNTRFGAST
jgi:ribosome-binding factor A